MKSRQQMKWPDHPSLNEQIKESADKVELPGKKGGGGAEKKAPAAKAAPPAVAPARSSGPPKKAPAAKVWLI